MIACTSFVGAPSHVCRGSEQKEDGDNLLKQQEYLAEFAHLRAQREKERLDAEVFVHVSRVEMVPLRKTLSSSSAVSLLKG